MHVSSLKSASCGKRERRNALPPVLFISLAILTPRFLHAETVGVKTSRQPQAQRVVECPKIDSTVTVDGKADEPFWRGIKPTRLSGLVDGGEPPYETTVKLAWDDVNLYGFYDCEEPDVRGIWGVRNEHLTRKTAEKWFSTEFQVPEWQIMLTDQFVKLILDTDGDGSGHFEFQFTPINNVSDMWHQQGFVEDHKRFLVTDVLWSCQNLRSATRIHGTVNAPFDVDEGWTLEFVIPWRSLAPQVQGACPPKNGDVWGVLLTRITRAAIGDKNSYWSFPVVGVPSCHYPDRFAQLVFKDELPKFQKCFGSFAKPNEEFVRKAFEIGVTDLVVRVPHEAWTSLKDRYKMGIYGNLNPPTVAEWKKAWPNEEPPLQKMSESQMEAYEFITKGYEKRLDRMRARLGRSDQGEDWKPTKRQRRQLEGMRVHNARWQSGYQYGGEPLIKDFLRRPANEVLIRRLLCFHDPQVVEMMKRKIDEWLALPYVDGVFLDFIGYQNYQDCACPTSKMKYQEYLKEHQLTDSKENWRRFSRDSLIDVYNQFVDYARSIKKDVKVSTHVYPAYLPEPLYGNRLKVEYCGQTAAWFSYWSPEKITAYSRIITSEQNKYWPDVNGVALIGYSSTDPAFWVKSPEKVESELRAILRGGSRLLMVCTLSDVLCDDDVANVFKRLCAKRK